MSQQVNSRPGPNLHGSLAIGADREVLPEGVRFERRPDGSVWRIEKLIVVDKKKGGPDTAEMRVDSVKDRDGLLKGITPWYEKHLPKQAPVKSGE
jgi:hypothetical protein